MRKIIMIIEKSPDLYCAYSEEEDVPFNGCGDTTKECKQNVQNCIEIVDEFNERSRPKFMDEKYELVYEFDLSATEKFLIKTEEDYKKALKRLEVIFDAEENTREGSEAEILTKLIEDYEAEHYPIDDPEKLKGKK